MPVPVPPGATVVEPRVPDPKENPVDMAALGATPSTRAEKPGTLLSPSLPRQVAQHRCGQEGSSTSAASRRDRRRRGLTCTHARRSPRAAARAPSVPEEHPSRRGPWDRSGGGASVRQPGWAPRLLS